MHKNNRNALLDDAWEFTEQIFVYDPAYPESEARIFISKNTGTYIWCFPTYGLVSTTSYPHESGNKSNNVFLGYCTNNVDDLNIVDYIDGSIAAGANTIGNKQVSIDSGVQAWTLSCKTEDGNQHHWNINGKVSEGNEKLLILGNPGDSDTSFSTTIFPPSSDSYSFESEEEPLDFMLSNADSLTIVQSGDKGIANIDNHGAAIETTDEAGVRISMTSNDAIQDTSWDTFEVVNDKASTLSLSLSDNGIIIKGNLNNLVITTVNDIRTDSPEEWPISTDYDSLLIKEENSELVAYVDKDGDGIHESLLDESSSGTVVDSGTCGDNLTWALDDKGTLTVSGTGAMKDCNVSFGGPWKSHREEIKNIVIKNGVTSIGSHAFIHCKELVKLSIPGSVVTIGERAFNNCAKLERLTIANGVAAIGPEAFCFCESLKRLVLPDSVTSIGNSAFHGCKSLTSLTLSNGVNNIGEYTFGWCESLKELEIPSNVTAIGDYAFYNCKSLTDLTISTGVQSIGGSAFSNCDSLPGVVIPNSVETIAKSAFDRSSGADDDFEQNLIIYGNKNTSAENFASKNGYIFIYLNARSIDNAVITVPDQTYTGTARVPALDVKVNGVSLTKDTDYLVKYTDNLKIGEATVKIIGIKNYQGSATTTFKINKGIQQISVTASSSSISLWDTATVTVTGAKGKTSFTSSDPSIATVDKQGKVTPVYPGTVTITVTADGDGNYEKASKSVTIKIEAISINKATVENLSDKTWTGKALTQNPLVKLNGNLLNSNSDYTVSYKDNTDVGTATMIITGNGYFKDTITRTFKINKADQSITVKSTASSIVVGKTATISITGAKGAKSYKSSDSSVATVNASTGLVTGKKAGTAAITATSAATDNYNAASKTIKITVTANKSLKKPGNCHFSKWNNSRYTSCRISWSKVDGAEGYQTLLSWTDGSHASQTNVKSNVLYRDCTVAVNHVSQMKVRAFSTANGKRVYSPWSNVEYITPSPTKFTSKNDVSGLDLKVNISWNIIYGCNGYNVFITTNPNGKWYWNQSTSEKATAVSASILKCGGARLKKKMRYYVRIVTRRKRNGVFCTVPMPADNTYIGSFIIK